MEQKQTKDIDFVEFQKIISPTSDEYNCYHINLVQNSGIVIDQEVLKSFLQHKMKILKSEKIYKAAWIKLEGKYIDYTPIALSQSFKIHHSQNNYILLYLWLKDDQQFNLPPYPNHSIASGGFVVNRKEHKILLVQEGKGLRQGRWGLPGGHVDNKEILYDAAIRQVKEETGLNTKLYELFGFQYANVANWDCESIYFIFVLELQNLNEDKTSIDSNELDGAKWIEIDKIEEFIKENNCTHQNFIAKFPQYYHEFMKQDIKKASTWLEEQQKK